MLDTLTCNPFGNGVPACINFIYWGLKRQSWYNSLSLHEHTGTHFRMNYGKKNLLTDFIYHWQKNGIVELKIRYFFCRCDNIWKFLKFLCVLHSSFRQSIDVIYDFYSFRLTQTTKILCKNVHQHARVKNRKARKKRTRCDRIEIKTWFNWKCLSQF